MADPAVETIATATGAVIGGAGVVLTFTGSIYGMDVQAMMCGFFGALIAKTLVPPSGPTGAPSDLSWRAWALAKAGRYGTLLLELLASGMLAALLGPAAEILMASTMSDRLTGLPLHLAASTIIGMTAPIIVALVRSVVTKLGAKP